MSILWEGSFYLGDKKGSYPIVSSLNSSAVLLLLLCSVHVKESSLWSGRPLSRVG